MNQYDPVPLHAVSPADQDAPARVLPSNVEAEAAFLGAVLIDNRVLEELPVNLNADHFFEPLHSRIFERIMVLIDRKAVVTPVTLKPYFEDDEALKELGTLVGTGKLRPRETVAEGIAAAPEAFLGLLKGKNFGKQLVKLI